MSVLNYKLGPWWDDDYGDTRGGRAKTKAKARDKRAWKLEVEEELEDMGRNPEEIFVIISEWKPVDSDYELEETVAYHRTEAGAILSLHAIAEGQGVNLEELGDATQFEINGPGRNTEYTTWYITTGILED